MQARESDETTLRTKPNADRRNGDPVVVILDITMPRLDGLSADAVSVDLRQMHALKTGRLIEAAVVCGALLGGLHASALRPYRAFAAELGVLFQIVDDILDVVGSDEQLGKTPGKDRQAGKVTYVSRFGLDRARQLADEALARAESRLAGLPGDTAGLRAVAGYIAGREH